MRFLFPQGMKEGKKKHNLFLFFSNSLTLLDTTSREDVVLHAAEDWRISNSCVTFFFLFLLTVVNWYLAVKSLHASLNANSSRRGFSFSFFCFFFLLFICLFVCFIFHHSQSIGACFIYNKKNSFRAGIIIRKTERRGGSRDQGRGFAQYWGDWQVALDFWRCKEMIWVSFSQRKQAGQGMGIQDGIRVTLSKLFCTYKGAWATAGLGEIKELLK